MVDNTQKIVVTDVQIPFWSMVVLMVKWALAAIPAVFILVVMAMLFAAAMGALFGGAGWYWGPGRMM